MKLTVVIEPEETGGYSAYCPSLPGCFSSGETREEAAANIREAIECHIESMKKDGLPIRLSQIQPVVTQVEVAV